MFNSRGRFLHQRSTLACPRIAELLKPDQNGSIGAATLYSRLAFDYRPARDLEFILTISTQEWTFPTPLRLPASAIHSYLAEDLKRPGGRMAAFDGAVAKPPFVQPLPAIIS